MLLHLLVLAPFVAAVLMAATSKEDPKSSSRLAFLFGYAFVALSIALIASGNQATEAIEWFHIPGAKGSVYYYLYSHGLGAWMVLLSTSLSLVALMTARNTLDTNYRNFAIGIFALMGAMNGTFLAADAVLFFFFFEAMVIPAAILIAAYGGKERTKAAMTFAIYTLVGSAPMMVALWYLVTVADNSLVLSLAVALQNLDPAVQSTLLACFLLAFMVKTPIFPFHGWQAITYAEAPAPLSAILTGAMSKAGVFGFIAWILPIFPLSMEWVDTMMWLGLLTAVYGAMLAFRATDGKKLLAYSSMGHLGLAVAGVFSLSESMLPAVLVLLVAHGLSAGAQFYLMGIAERFAGTRDIEQLGGLAKRNPVFGSLFGFVAVLSLAVPGTAGFVGEFTVLMSLWDMGPLPALAAGLCLILSAAYMLRFVQKVIFGTPARQYEDGKRMTALEGSSIGIMGVLLLVFGMHPAFITNALQLFDENAVQEMNRVSHPETAPVESSTVEASADVTDDASADENVAAVAQPMTEEDLQQLDSNLKANGFSDEERASLIAQLKAMSESEVAEAPEQNEATANEEASENE
ncbi:NADH-quinone oxidoreductase subunit M [Fibrobacter sp.]|uniref:complex I subunit 4 family protein n=1 Tax=Fibrobacter sp. TaxID=35828 RepID=UPI0025B9CF26|nr:NADH-quinone oxidoreductase subunit M [Fibrobacter sp.]MBS7272499.1 NADH-quinone oxidoreductase subunit M [Fibrobacter sp.]MCI6436275.1 NADH-quinone oxidoreductase subunit M [Fibrobacter sp.]MDD7498103.1 NADH-quinone oxidoreductase subunit M [Fibrobacter sp.]MDY5724807.1 NADH-quinone oxidoreductase subunit M [Fibrobacter sp.]